MYHLLQSQLEGAHAKWYFVHLNWSNEHFCYNHYIIMTNSLCITLDTSNALDYQRAKKVVSDSPGLVDFAIGLRWILF